MIKVLENLEEWEKSKADYVKVTPFMEASYSPYKEILISYLCDLMFQEQQETVNIS